MIDTDKYEGHTEAPWTLYHRAGGKPTIAGKLSEVDWKLIADAPLFLAEVKRLREEKTFLWETYLKESAEVKRLREAIQQIIEYNEGVDVDMFGSQVSDKLKEMIE